MRAQAPVLAGLAAGGLGALATGVVSLGLRSPDAAFLNSLSVGLSTLVLGLLAGLGWRQLSASGAGRRAFIGIWVGFGILVIGAAALSETLIEGMLTYAVPLGVLAFVATGVLTPLLAPYLVGQRRLATPAVLLLGAGVCAMLAGRAAPPSEAIALPTLIASPIASPMASPQPVVGASPAAPSPVARATTRATGHYANVNFAIGSGSKATFTVREQLARMPLPNDAVVSTSALSGEMHLDGRPSTVQLDLQRLSSDQPNRDKYIRNTLFAGEKSATFSVDQPKPLAEGETVGPLEGTVMGMLTIKGGSYPLSIDWQARDDGDAFSIKGHTTFTWKDVGLDPPSSAALVSAEDLINCDVLLIGRPT